MDDVFTDDERLWQERVADEHALMDWLRGRRWSCYCVYGCGPCRARKYEPRSALAAAVTATVPQQR